MKVDWPENEKIGELLFRLQQFSIAAEWLVQELEYARKKRIDDPDQYVNTVQQKIEELSVTYRGMLDIIKNKGNTT